MPKVPGAGWYAAAGVLALAGICVAALLVWRAVAETGDPIQMLAPGEAVVSLAKPGAYVIWHEHRSVFEGRHYDTPKSLPDGVQFDVIAPDGSRPRVVASRSASVSGGSVERAAAAEFDAPAAGRYRIIVAGSFPPRVLSVGPNFFWPLFKAIGYAFAAAMIGIGAGIALGLYAFLKQVPAQSAPAAVEAFLDADHERRLRQLVALVYGLQAASLLVGVTLFAGVIVNYVKRREAEGTWLDSHFRWQIRTFWWTLAWGVLGLATAIILVGFVVLIAASVWLIYRIAKGWTDLNDGRPVGV